MQRHLLDTLEQFEKRVEAQPSKQQVLDSKEPVTIPGNRVDGGEWVGDGVWRVPIVRLALLVVKSGTMPRIATGVGWNPENPRCPQQGISEWFQFGLGAKE